MKSQQSQRRQWPGLLRNFLCTLFTGFIYLSTLAGARAQSWTLAWSDEFNGATVGPPDITVWNFDLGNSGFGNNELETYCGPPGYKNNPQACPNTFSTTTSNAYIDGNGHLVIQAIQSGGTWFSARMNTNMTPQKTFQYGRIEASEKLPVGAGLWPAFWALGSNFASVTWPGCGEMDFMENVPASAGLGPTKISSTIHGPTYYGSNGLSQIYTFPSKDVTSFHTYGAIWSPFMVQFYVDDPANVFSIHTATDVPGGPTQWAFNHPFVLITNLAVGGTWPGSPDSTTPNPAMMMVDYVRQYRATAVPSPNLGNPAAITLAAGADSGSTTVDLSSQSGTGRVYLNCSTSTPNFSCSINTGYALNSNVVDFTSDSTATATVTVNLIAYAASMPVENLFIPKPPGRAAIALAGIMVCVLVFSKEISRRGRPARNWAPALALSGLILAGAIVLSCGGSSSSPPVSTPPSYYSVTVNAYTVSGTGAAPDATVNIQMVVFH